MHCNMPTLPKSTWNCIYGMHMLDTSMHAGIFMHISTDFCINSIWGVHVSHIPEACCMCPHVCFEWYSKKFISHPWWNIIRSSSSSKLLTSSSSCFLAGKASRRRRSSKQERIWRTNIIQLACWKLWWLRLWKKKENSQVTSLLG